MEMHFHNFHSYVHQTLPRENKLPQYLFKYCFDLSVLAVCETGGTAGDPIWALALKVDDCDCGFPAVQPAWHHKQCGLQVEGRHALLIDCIIIQSAGVKCFSHCMLITYYPDNFSAYCCLVSGTVKHGYHVKIRLCRRFGSVQKF